MVKDEPGWFDAARKNTFGDGMRYSHCGLADRLRSIITFRGALPRSPHVSTLTPIVNITAVITK